MNFSKNHILVINTAGLFCIVRVKNKIENILNDISQRCYQINVIKVFFSKYGVFKIPQLNPSLSS